MFQLTINGRSHKGVDIAGEQIILPSSSRFMVKATRVWTSQASKVESPLNATTNPPAFNGFQLHNSSGRNYDALLGTLH